MVCKILQLHALSCSHLNVLRTSKGLSSMDPSVVGRTKPSEDPVTSEEGITPVSWADLKCKNFVSVGSKIKPKLCAK